MRRLALGCALAVLLAGAYGLARLGLRERPAITAVATPPPVRHATPIELPRGRRACERDVALGPNTRVVRLYSASPTPDVPRLRVTVRGGGWSAAGISPAGAGPGSGADGIYDTPIPAPPRSLLATVCVRSAQSRPAILAGSLEDGVRSRSPTLVDGRAVRPRMALVLLSGPPRSPLAHVREVLERAASFQPPVVGWVSLALLALAVVVVVPAAAVYAALRALRDDGAG